MRKKSVFQPVKQFFSIPDEIVAEEYRFTRPFLIILVLVLTFIYGFALYSRSELRTPGPLAGFTFLMALHIVLHWRSIVLVRRPGWAMPYVLVQSVITLLIVYLLEEWGLAFGVVAGMIGESVGILRERRGIAALVVIFLLTGMFGALQISGQNASPVPWTFAIPIVLFVVIYVELYSRQDDARQQAQGLFRALEAAHRELTQYAARVEELTLHAERERMAFELHDTLGQGVAGLVLQLEAVKNHLENGRTARAEEIVSQAMQRARTTLAESRAVIDDLRQARQGQISLTDAVSELVEEFKQTGGTTIDLNMVYFPEDLEVPGLVVEYAEKVISEALFNIVRHAQAAHVSLVARGSADKLEIEIQDDGIGFDQKRIGQDGHYGLLGMQERARQLGGTCDILSQPGKGTSIKVVFPLNQECV